MANDKTEAAGRSFAAARKNLMGLFNKGPKATEDREQALLDSVDARHLRQPTTNRRDLFAFRARPGLQKACQKIAHDRGIPFAKLMEEICEAAIAAHNRKRGKS
jgi:hypothetical protein